MSDRETPSFVERPRVMVGEIFSYRVMTSASYKLWRGDCGRELGCNQDNQRHTAPVLAAEIAHEYSLFLWTKVHRDIRFTE